VSGATAFSLVGFVSPAVFAWDGGSSSGYDNTNGYSTSNYSSYNNYDSGNYGGGNNYNCMMRDDNDNGWDGNYSNRYCMSRTTYSISSYNKESRCDHQY
jgi:hypothetical protein